MVPAARHTLKEDSTIREHWFDRSSAAIDGDPVARDAVRRALELEEPALRDALCAGRAREGARVETEDRTGWLREHVAAALESNRPWAQNLLHAGLASEVDWARRVFIDGLRHRRHWAWVGYHAWYHERVVGICHRVLGDEGMARELADEVALRFIEKWAHGPRPLQTFPGFLWKVARTQALKRRQQQLRVDLTGDLESLLGRPGERAGEAETVEQRMLDEEREKLLRAALSALSEDQRQLLRQRIELDRTLKEIARDEACTLQNIHNKLRRVLQRLRAYLEEQSDDPGERR